MSDVSQVNLDGGYVPVSATKKKNPIALGWYPCHIVDCTVVTKTVKGKHKAKIYNPTLEVAPIPVKDVTDCKSKVKEPTLDVKLKPAG